jgi:type IV pilus assembly protein PilC
MPVYLCRTANAQGKVEEFRRDAASEEPLVRELSARGYYVLSVKELLQGEKAATRTRRFPRKAIGELTDLLSLMLGSGLSLKDSLEVAETVFSKGAANDLVTLLLEKIRKGGNFASALESTGNSFPSVYRGMVRIGERIGTLDQVFGRLSTYLKDEKKLRERFGAALTYPLIVLGVATLSGLMIVFFLLPRLREVFSQIGPAMAGKFDSLMRSLVVSFSAIGIVVVLAVSVIIGALVTRKKGGPLAVRIDAFILKIPIISSLLLDRELLNFAFAMETLTTAGVSVEEALSESSGAAENKALQEQIFAIREKAIACPPRFQRAPSFRRGSRAGWGSVSGSGTWRRYSDSFVRFTNRRWRNG